MSTHLEVCKESHELCACVAGVVVCVKLQRRSEEHGCGVSGHCGSPQQGPRQDTPGAPAAGNTHRDVQLQTS